LGCVGPGTSEYQLSQRQNASAKAFIDGSIVGGNDSMTTRMSAGVAFFTLSPNTSSV
jgi:hypothetical protein